MKLHKDPNGGPDADPLTTNEYIQQIFLKSNNDVFTDEFPGIPAIGIPVLYDTISDMDLAATGAFLPNAVNLVVAGNRSFDPAAIWTAHEA